MQIHASCHFGYIIHHAHKTHLYLYISYLCLCNEYNCSGSHDIVMNAFYKCFIFWQEQKDAGDFSSRIGCGENGRLICMGLTLCLSNIKGCFFFMVFVKGKNVLLTPVKLQIRLVTLMEGRYAFSPALEITVRKILPVVFVEQLKLWLTLLVALVTCRALYQ